LITQKKLFDKNKLISPQISLSDILFLEEEGNSKEANNLETICTPGDLAYIIYTSGTSGKPKGAMIQHRGLVNYIWWASKTYIRNENLNFPLYTSISFDLTITSIFTPLITGNTIIVYREQERDFLLEKIIDENRVGVVKLTPSHLKLIREKIMDRRLSSIKCFIVGGESLEYNLAREIHRKFYGGIEIYNEYGPTETVVGCMVYRFNPAEAASQTVPIGKPINNTRIYILDKEMNPVPFGVPGELYVSGDGVCRGYLKRKELNLNKFMSNPFVPQQKLYRTGDIVWMRADGTVEFLGRIDNQVKIRGFRIELGEIENQILQHDGIKDVVVTARKNEDGDVYLCAYVVAPQEFNVTELRKYLAGELPDYMIPPFFSQLDRVPLTPNGKVDLKALDAYDPHLDTGIEYEAPGNDTEELITAIWKEVLHLDKIGVHDNFFDVGGHSLNIIRISGKLKKNFGREIPVVSMFRYPTIRSLANHLDNRETDECISDEKIDQAINVMEETTRFFLEDRR
jgi:tyrocidine synthetase-3